jgi:uncharacterized protein (UPF0333 family)
MKRSDFLFLFALVVLIYVSCQFGNFEKARAEAVASTSPAIGSEEIAGIMSMKLTNPLKGGVKTFGGLMELIADFIFSLSIPIAVILIIVAGFYMLTSGGNQQRYAKGLAILRWTILGLAVVLIGKGFVSLVRSLLDIKP